MDGGHRKERRGLLIDQGLDSYTGASPAHEAMEHIVEATAMLVNILVEYHVAQARSDGLDHLANAVALLRRCNLDDLTLPTRWVLTMRMDMLRRPIDAWVLSHRADPAHTAVNRAFDAIGGIMVGLFTPADHWLRLYGTGLITDAELERGLDEESLVPHATRDELLTFARDFHAAMTALPIP